MEGSGHLPKAGIRIDQHCLRGLEGAAGLQLPGEVIGIDAQHRAHLVELVHFRLSLEIAGIDKVHGVDLPGGLGHVGAGQRQEGMLLVAGFAADGAGSLEAIAQLAVLHPPLSGPAAMKGEQGVIFVVHIQAGGEHLGQVNRLCSAIHHPDASGDHIQLAERGILQHHFQRKEGIGQSDFQTVAVLLRAKGGRKPLKLWFAPENPMAFVVQLHPIMALLGAHLQAMLPEIPNASRGILEGSAVQKGKLIPQVSFRGVGMLIGSR